MPQMQPVKSSNLSYIGYDAEAKELHVTFAQGGTYIYSGVDATTYQNMLESESPGGFLHRNIRDRYPHRRE